MVYYKIGAVVVLYNPDLARVLPAIHSLASQIQEICIVDNSTSVIDVEEFSAIHNLHYIRNGRNEGIACAQNKGVHYLLERKFNYILFSDQDSVAPENLVSHMIHACKKLQNEGINVGAIGTRAYSKRTGEIYPTKNKELGAPVEFKCVEDQKLLTECYSVRSSISLVPATAFYQVGGFDESLFIDGVDHEWCWRAWHKARLRSFILESLRIAHSLGEEDRKVGRLYVSVPSVFRVYFQFRNIILLSKRSYTPKFWIRRHRKLMVVKIGYYLVMIPPRLKYLKNMYKGIRDGLKSSAKGEWPKFGEKSLGEQ